MKKLAALMLCLALLCAMAIPAMADMQKGSKGDDVAKLQQRLIDLGYLTDTADGSFGGHTETALKAFQAANGLEETGIATDADTEVLYSDSAIDSQGNSAAPAEEGAETEAEPEAEAEPEEAPEEAPATPSRTVARDKLTIWGETFVPITNENSNDYVYVYARVENTSDKEVIINNKLFEIYDANDDVIKSEDYLYCEPSTLQPGESAYLYKNMYLDDGMAAADVADYELDLNCKSEGNYVVTRYPVEVEYVANDPNNGNRGRIYITVTNDTDETVYDMQVCYALLNDIGEVIFAYGNSTSVGLLPGSSMVFPGYIDYNMEQYMKANNIEPATADAIAFTSKYR